jgi:regulator of telomere elongation helicase 1
MHATLGSREQMCVNPAVKKQNSCSADINHDCNKLGKDRKCKFRNNLEGFTAPSNETSTGNDTQPVMDMEDLVSMGKEHKICPFYYTRSLVDNAEILFVPYNYLFDKDARETTLQGVPWDNSVVIFDEAHNLEAFASESASFDLSNTDISGCIIEVDRTIGYLRAIPDSSHGLKEDNLLRLKAIFLKLEAYILKLGSQSAYSGEFMIEFFQKGSGINHSNHELFIEQVQKVNAFLMDMRGSGATRGSPKLEHFVQCLKRVYGHPMESRCLAKAAFYRVHVTPKPNTGTSQKNQGRTVSYWCFAPALAMEELAALNVRSIIVTSGTLSPLPSYSLELGLPFPHTLENPHIICKEQIHVRVVGKGVSGKLLSSSYERRQDGEYYTELGNTLVSLAQVTPAGMLVFFPSYGVMEACLERWGGPASNNSSSKGQSETNAFFAPRRRQESSKRYSFPFAPGLFYDNSAPATPWTRLLSKKAVVVEPRSSADLPDAISEFQRFLGLPKSPGCVLMGVCRGKISEGIDFANEQSRAVIITGLPFPPSFDPKVKMKQEYLNRAKATSSIQASKEGGFGADSRDNPSFDKLSGQAWYTQQAHRAVNQAIGRVIRNRLDYGAVLLLDTRFGQPNNQEGLSKWIRPHIQNDEGFGKAISGLAKFYKEADMKVQEVAKAESNVVALEYEEDENIMNVAIVRQDAFSANDGENWGPGVEDTMNYIPPEMVAARMNIECMQKKVILEESLKSTKPTEHKVTGYDAVFGASAKPTLGAHKQMAATVGAKSVAVLFLEKANTSLRSEELSCIKRSIVAMKKFGGMKDSLLYIKEATEIIAIILKYENLRDGFDVKGETMLALFFELLPPLHRQKCEEVAMEANYNNSLLCKLCTNHFTGGQCDVPIDSLLRFLWGCSTKDNETYFRKATDVLKIFLEAEASASKALIDAYLKFIPTRYYNATQSLILEMSASTSVLSMRRKDRQIVGENSLNADVFRLPYWNVKAPASVNDDNNTPVSVSGDRVVDVLPFSSVLTAPPHVKRSREDAEYGTINPYAKKSSQNQHPPKQSALPKLSAIMKKIETEAAVNPYAKKGLLDQNRPVHMQPSAPAMSSLVTNARSDHSVLVDDTSMPNSCNRHQPPTVSGKTSMSSIMKKVETETYVKLSSSDICQSIQSNAPKNLNVTCPICSQNVTNEPYLAECGHMACKSCWRAWLGRSQTCPTCRLPASLQRIARVVFQKRPGSDAPTSLSQLCEPSAPAEDVEDSDEELEIA